MEALDALSSSEATELNRLQRAVTTTVARLSPIVKWLLNRSATGTLVTLDEPIPPSNDRWITSPACGNGLSLAPSRFAAVQQPSEA